MTDEARSREADYFWRKDQELIDKMRRAAANEQAVREMGTRAGLNEPELIHELAALGFTIDTVDLLPLRPLIQVAWIEGGVSAAERHLIINLARSRGISEGSAADRQLSTWLATPPDAQVFTRSTRLIWAMLSSGTIQEHVVTVQGMLSCRNVSRACHPRRERLRVDSVRRVDFPADELTAAAAHGRPGGDQQGGRRSHHCVWDSLWSAVRHDVGRALKTAHSQPLGFMEDS